MCVCVCVWVCVCVLSVCVYLTAFFDFQDTVSVHRPSFYADRFLKFMGSTVFKKIHRKFINQHNSCILYPDRGAFYCTSLCLCLSALRGASSKRKKSSFYAAKSASQEFLSPLKEEKQEEKKAQSMDNLDGNCKLNGLHTFKTTFFSLFLLEALFFRFYI